MSDDWIGDSMTFDSIRIYSKDIKNDELIYQYLTGCHHGQIVSRDEEILFDNGSVVLFLKNGSGSPCRVGRSTGLNFISADIEYDCRYLESIGAIVGKIELSECESYYQVECDDVSGNSVTLMQINESSQWAFG